MMSPLPKNQKKPYGSRLYTCAEDLCDPYESDASDAGEGGTPQRDRAHAVRLVDELAKESAPSARGEWRGTPASAQEPAAPRITPRGREAGRRDAVGEYAILSVCPSGEGESVSLILSAPAGMNGTPAEDEGSGEHPRKPARERLRLYLLIEQYADLQPQVGEVTREEAEALLDAGRFCAAVKRGMRLLDYGDRSARRLAYQLTAKGIARTDAERAAAYLAEKGYIREESTAALRAEANVRKLWGPRRIREDLRANGFTPDAVTEAMEALSDVDFEENCAALIRKKYRPLPTERAERQRMIAALMRQGYDMDVIRAAARRVERER